LVVVSVGWAEPFPLIAARSLNLSLRRMCRTLLPLRPAVNVSLSHRFVSFFVSSEVRPNDQEMGSPRHALHNEVARPTLAALVYTLLLAKSMPSQKWNAKIPPTH